MTSNPLVHPISTDNNHPSIAQRKKLEEARKQRLTKALRKNLQKRKEQIRARRVENT